MRGRCRIGGVESWRPIERQLPVGGRPERHRGGVGHRHRERRCNPSACACPVVRGPGAHLQQRRRSWCRSSTRVGHRHAIRIDRRAVRVAGRRRDRRLRSRASVAAADRRRAHRKRVDVPRRGTSDDPKLQVAPRMSVDGGCAPKVTIAPSRSAPSPYTFIAMAPVSLASPSHRRREFAVPIVAVVSGDALTSSRRRLRIASSGVVAGASIVTSARRPFASCDHRHSRPHRRDPQWPPSGQARRVDRD